MPTEKDQFFLSDVRVFCVKTLESQTQKISENNSAFCGCPHFSFLALPIYLFNTFLANTNLTY